MSHDDDLSFAPTVLNETINISASLNTTSQAGLAVRIGFQIGQTLSILCIIFGTVGNAALIFTICRSSFCRFSYGLILVFIAIFDIVRLLSIVLYYLFQANLLPLNIVTSAIYIVLYRYSKNVTNWLKVFLAVERLIAVKYWLSNRYNVNSKLVTDTQRCRQRRVLGLIFLLLVCALISQHPNLLYTRYKSSYIDPARLFLVNTPNPNFRYGPFAYNGVLYIIISYIMIDDVLPISALLVCNMVLFCRLRSLPLITSRKIAESIWILFFLTIFSIFVVPRSFIVFWNLYMNSKYINDAVIAVITHTLQGIEMMNHAITGYACFLSCENLRKTLLQSVQTGCKIMRKKLHIKSEPSAAYTIEQTSVSSKRT